MTVGRSLVTALKRTAPALCLPVGQPPVALLRPVPARAEWIRPSDVAALTAWRNRFAGAFLTEFAATEARTLRWLTEAVAADEGKILFMADAADGRTFGYLGLDAMDWERRVGEADAIVRGEPAPPGAMAASLTALLRWAREGLGLHDLWVRVLSDNPALHFYGRVGFQERRRVPLRREETAAGEFAWVEAPSLSSWDRSLVHMQWT
jgi:RimJ/RimL family protein N-acetyltransferase